MYAASQKRPLACNVTQFSQKPQIRECRCLNLHYRLEPYWSLLRISVQPAVNSFVSSVTPLSTVIKSNSPLRFLGCIRRSSPSSGTTYSSTQYVAHLQPPETQKRPESSHQKPLDKSCWRCLPPQNSTSRLVKRAVLF